MRAPEPPAAGRIGESGRRVQPLWRLGRVTVALMVAWLVVMGFVGWALNASQDHGRKSMAARAESRTRYAASLVSIYARDLLARERRVAQRLLEGTQVSRDQLRRVAAALGMSDPALVSAHGSAAGTGDVSLTELRGAPVISFAVGYQTASGPRVFSGIYPIGDTVLPAVLNQVLTMTSWQAELVDTRGGRLVSGRSMLPEGHEAVFTAPIAGTDWRAVVRIPETELYGLLERPARWLALAGLVGLAVAGLAILVPIARMARRHTQLTILNAELTRLAAVDSLTGLRNRRAIEENLQEALSAARRHELSLSLLVIDIDYFKNFNDMLGHDTGDAVLAHTARVLNGAMRAEDAIGRWGGEEFLVVLPGTDEEGALHATERLRAALDAHQPEEARAHGMAVTVTIGLAEWHHEAMDELVSRADRALYLGKAAGRDTVKVEPGLAGALEAGEPV